MVALSCPSAEPRARRRLTIPCRRPLVARQQPEPELFADRPQTRAACRDAVRPCPWVGCQHHLYLDVNPHTGSITLNHPDLEPGELADSCALDVAERGGVTLEEVGEVLNLTRERIRQIEAGGLLKLRRATPDDLAACYGGAPPAGRRQRGAREDDRG